MNGLKTFDSIMKTCDKGKKLEMTLEVPTIAQGSRAILPALVARGLKPGPRVLMFATQHGRELHGLVALGRAFEKIDPENLSGEVVFLPVLNPLAVRMRTQDFPNELKRFRSSQKSCWNMNRTWGLGVDSWSGSISSYIGECFVKNVDAVIDLHGWSGLSTAWSRDRDMLLAFGCPSNFIRKVDPLSGMLEDYCDKLGIQNLVVELAPQNQLDIKSLAMAELGIFNMLKYLKLLPGKLCLPDIQYIFNNNQEDILFAKEEGICEPMVSMGDLIESNQVIAKLWNLSTMTSPMEIRSPNKGLVFSICKAPSDEDCHSSCMVNKGDFLAIIKPDIEIIKNT